MKAFLLLFLFFSVSVQFRVLGQGNLLPAESSLEKAKAFFLNQNYFMAEATLMGSQTSDDPEMRALLLVHTAQKIGNLEEKIEFFSGYLGQGPQERQVALLFRAWAYAFLRDWDQFRGQAVSALMEVESFPNNSNLLLIYCLARYTQQSVNELNLTVCQRSWFEAVRAAPAHQKLPFSFSCAGFPDFVTDLACLGAKTESPGRNLLGKTSSLNDNVLIKLNSINDLLVRGDLNQAAGVFNAFDKTELRPFPWDFRIEYYRLLTRFFEMNEEPERQAKMEAQVNRLTQDFCLSFECFQDQVKPKLIVEGNKTSIEIPQSIHSFQDLEKAIPQLDNESLKNYLNDLSSSTKYDQIFKNYLLGIFNLKKGRFQSAYSFLSKAETDISSTPFSNLEVKILSAMGDYYLSEKNVDQANWYWIAAIQTLSGSEALCLLDLNSDLFYPFEAMIDAFLLKPAENQVSAILYAQQMLELIQKRLVAYQHGAISTNRVISNQILEIGGQMRAEVEQLKKSDSYSGKTLKDLKELWGQLWDKTKAEYQNLAPLNLREIQACLSPEETLIVLCEGNNQLGAVVAAKDRAFVSYLGTKSAFSGSLDLLVEQQLGKAIEFSSKSGVLSLSGSFLNPGFLENLINKNRANSFQVIFQLAAIQTKWSPLEVGQMVVFYDGSVEAPEDLSTFAIHGIEASITSSFNQPNIDRLLVQNPVMVLKGNLQMASEGVVFGQGSEKKALWDVTMEHSLGGIGVFLSNLGDLGGIQSELKFISQIYQIPILILRDQDAGVVLPEKLRRSALVVF